MGKYTQVESGFDQVAAANARIKDVDQSRTAMVTLWKASFDRFWQSPLTHGDRALTKEQMQAVLDSAPEMFNDVLNDSKAFLQFLSVNHPDVFVSEDDEEPLVPERYTIGVYNMSVNDGKIVLGDLLDSWKDLEEQESLSKKTEGQESGE